MCLDSSDLMGPQPSMYPRPMPGGGAASYGRGGPLPYGGPQAGGPPPMDGGSRGGMGGSGRVGGGYQPFEGGFARGSDMGRFGGGGVDRVANGGMGERPGRFGAGASYSGGRSGGGGGRGGRGFDGGYSGGRGGGRFSSDGGRGSSGGRGGRHGRSRDDLDNLTLPKQDFGNLVPFEKNFYVENHAVRAMTDQEVAHYRARRDITIEGQDVPRPIQMFHEANFPGITALELNVLINLAKSVEICLIELV